MSSLKSLKLDLIDAILEGQRQGYNNPLEPFEAYANRVKEEWMSTYDEYIKSLQHGYEAIVETIDAEIHAKNLNKGKKV